MSTLDGITLPDGLEWIDKHSSSPVAQTVLRTLGGALVTYYQNLTDGVPITLIAQDRVAWFDQSQVDALKAIADVAGAIYVLDWNGTIYNVMFRHQEPPAIDFSTILPHAEFHFGTIKLMTV